MVEFKEIVVWESRQTALDLRELLYGSVESSMLSNYQQSLIIEFHGSPWQV